MGREAHHLPPDSSALRSDLDAFRSHLEDAAATNPFLDRGAAHGLVEWLSRILDRWPALNAGQSTQVIDTVRYVTEPDDEEHDLLSPIGLVDDAEHVTALEASSI
jgi:hypothetical protein